jgi:hypothetical protein
LMEGLACTYSPDNFFAPEMRYFLHFDASF